MLPKEKLEQYGAGSLVFYELISLILYTGSRKLDVFNLSQRIAPMFLNSNSVLELTRTLEYMGINGIKRAQILALYELISRIRSNQGAFTSPYRIYRFFEFLTTKRKEYLYSLLLDRSLRYITHILLATGNDQNVLFSKAQTTRRIFDHMPPIIVLVHNHPSGNPEPSQQDIETTHWLKQRLEQVGVTLLDHVIVARSGFFSFKQAQML